MPMHEGTHPFEGTILRALEYDVTPHVKSSHPTLETLLDLMTDDLSAADRGLVEAHCLVCTECKRRLELLDTRLRDIQEDLHREVTRGWSFSALFDAAQSHRRRVRWMQRALATASLTTTLATLGVSIPRFIQIYQSAIARGQSVGIPPYLYVLLGLALAGIVGLIAFIVWRKKT